eukprot:1390184-Amorphochlora_amoeboformis.AAC.1
MSYPSRTLLCDLVRLGGNDFTANRGVFPRRRSASRREWGIPEAHELGISINANTLDSDRKCDNLFSQVHSRSEKSFAEVG